MRNEEYFAERYFIFNVSYENMYKDTSQTTTYRRICSFCEIPDNFISCYIFNTFFLKLHIANNFFEQLTIFQTYIFCVVIFCYLDFRAGLGALISLLLCAS